LNESAIGGPYITRLDLATELGELKRSSQHSYEDLHRLTGRSRTTLHDWITVKHLPVARDNGDFRALAELLGAASPDELLARVIALRNPEAQALSNPYKGLAPFTEQDSGIFFGRDALTTVLVDHALSSFADQGCNPLILLGASGSGKTSLLRAGLLAELERRPGFEVSYTTPSSSTFASPSSGPNVDRRVVVVDQFEEHFSQERSDRFSHTLAAMSSFCEEPDTLLVIGVRSDFFHRVAEVPFLLGGLQNSSIVVGGMTVEEVTAAIAGPAEKASIRIAPDLLVELLGEFGNSEQVGILSNSLPLLSHVLRELVEASGRAQLTASSYREMGGLGHAIERSAEKAFVASHLGEEACQKLFGQLVDIGPDARPTRRVVSMATIANLYPQAEFDSIIEEFTSHRLLTIDFDMVSISHEALLTAWPRLAAWVSDSQAAMLEVSRLRLAASLWSQLGRVDDALLRGTQLATANEVLEAPQYRMRLNDVDLEFVEASREAESERQIQSRQISSRRLAAQADLLYGSSPNLSAQVALVAQDTAATVESRSALLRSTSPLPEWRMLGSPGNTVLATAPGHRVAVLAHASDEIVRMVDFSQPQPFASPDRVGRGDVRTTAVALSADGQMFAQGMVDGSVILADLTEPRSCVEVPTRSLNFVSPVNALCFNHDRTLLFGAAGVDAVACWSLTSRPEPILSCVVPTPGTTLAVSVDSSDSLMATANELGSVALWPLSDLPEPVWTELAPGHGPATDIALSSDGAALAAGYHNGRVRVWNIQNHPLVVTEAALVDSQFGSWVNSVSFSPNGQLLAAASSDGNIRLWDTDSWTKVLQDSQHPTVVTSVRFVDETTLATTAEDGTLRTWDVSRASQPRRAESVWSLDFDQTGAVRANASRSLATVAHVDKRSGRVEGVRHFSPLDGVEFSGTSAVSPDGKLLAIGTRTGAIRIEQIVRRPTSGEVNASSPNVLEGLTSLVENVSFSPDGRLLCGVDRQGVAQIWALNHQGAVLAGGRVEVEPPAVNLAFASDSNLLAVTSESGHTSLFDVADSARPRLLKAFRSGTSFAMGIAFHPERPVLAIGNADQSTSLWDVTNETKPTLLHRLSGVVGSTIAVAFSETGDLLAVGTTSGMVSIWDTTDVSAPPELYARFSSPERGVYALAFSPAGETLCGVGPNQGLFNWTLNEDDAVDSIRAAVGDPLTVDEWDLHLSGHRHVGVAD